MTMMRTLDAAPDELSPDWDEDTIYCAATAPPEDVIYEGSEDEHYSSPPSRRSRYEAAGQRYLDGRLPFLLSASLRGPFDKKSGWVNPWRSKTRTSKAPGHKASASPRTRHAANNDASPAEIPDSVECHLPSPESLKQADITEPHPYLEEDELAEVHKWRTGVRPGPVPDDFWASHSEETASAKKRRAANTEWLKKPPQKRRKKDAMESGPINTPSHRRRSPRFSTRENGAAFQSSFSSALGHLTSASKQSPSRRQALIQAADRTQNDFDDELMDAGLASFHSAPPKLSTPSKRVSPRRTVHKSSGGRTKAAEFESEDELSQEKAAAATLSSPVSQDGPSQRSSRLPSSSQNQSPRAATLARSGSIPRSSRGQPKQSCDPTSAQENVAMENADNGEGGEGNSAVLETQHDHSFCYKMRPKPVVNGPRQEHQAPAQVSEPPSSPLSSAPSWSGISDDDLNPIQTTENTSPASAEMQHDLDGRNTKPAAGNQASLSPEPPDAQVKDTARLSAHNAGNDALNRAEPEAQDPRLLHIGDEEAPGDEDASSAQNKPAPEKASHTAAMDEPDGHQPITEDPVAPLPSTERVNSATGGSSGKQEARGSQKPWDFAKRDSLGNRHSPPLQPQSEDHIAADLGPETCENDPAANAFVPSLSSSPSTDDNDARPGGDGNASSAQRVDPPSNISAEFSLKNVIQRLVPSSPWAKFSSLGRSPVAAPPQPQSNSDEAAHKESDSLGKLPTTEDNNLDARLISDNASRTDRVIAVSGEEEPEDEPRANQGNDTTGDRVYLDHEPHDGAEQILGAGATEQADPAPVSLSQQSPWTKSWPSQDMNMAAGQMMITGSPAVTTPQRSPSVPDMALTEDQTWVSGIDSVPMLRDQPTLPPMLNEAPSKGSADRSYSFAPDNLSAPFCTPALPIRRSTPEPQFTVKSFASFMSPSPRRPSRQVQRSRGVGPGSQHSSQGILSSAMKSRDSARSPRRVSWAPLPFDAEDGFASEADASTATGRERPASPPPAAPIADLPTSEDAKFHNHFNAMASRKSVLKRRLLPSASQWSQQSPAPLAMAEKFLAADEMHGPPSAPADENAGDADEQDREDEHLPLTEDPFESQDLVQEVFDDMAGFLEGFDVGAELDQARKVEGEQISAVVAQSPWGS